MKQYNLSLALVKMNKALVLGLFSVLVSVSLCSAECNCPKGTHCYMEECRSGREIAEMAFEAGSKYILYIDN